MKGLVLCLILLVISATAFADSGSYCVIPWDGDPAEFCSGAYDSIYMRGMGSVVYRVSSQNECPAYAYLCEACIWPWDDPDAAPMFPGIGANAILSILFDYAGLTKQPEWRCEQRARILEGGESHIKRKVR